MPNIFQENLVNFALYPEDQQYPEYIRPLVKGQ